LMFWPYETFPSCGYEPRLNSTALSRKYASQTKALKQIAFQTPPSPTQFHIIYKLCIVQQSVSFWVIKIQKHTPVRSHTGDHTHTHTHQNTPRILHTHSSGHTHTHQITPGSCTHTLIRSHTHSSDQTHWTWNLVLIDLPVRGWISDSP